MSLVPIINNGRAGEEIYELEELNMTDNQFGKVAASFSSDGKEYEIRIKISPNDFVLTPCIDGEQINEREYSVPIEDAYNLVVVRKVIDELIELVKSDIENKLFEQYQESLNFRY